MTRLKKASRLVSTAMRMREVSTAPLSRWFLAFLFGCLIGLSATPALAAELPGVRLAHAAFNEKVEALWLGAEQGLFRKKGVDVELVYIRTGPQAIAAMASGGIPLIST